MGCIGCVGVHWSIIGVHKGVWVHWGAWGHIAMGGCVPWGRVCIGGAAGEMWGPGKWSDRCG